MSFEYQPDWKRRGQNHGSENQQGSQNSQGPQGAPASQPPAKGRYNTSEDPDLLRDIVQQSRRQPLDVQRQTTQEIRALRVSTEKEAEAAVVAQRKVQQFFSSLWAGISALFHRESTQRSSQCNIYGHVVESGWTGTLPKCSKCGAVVTSADQLRGSSPKGTSK